MRVILCRCTVRSVTTLHLNFRFWSRKFFARTKNKREWGTRRNICHVESARESRPNEKPKRISKRARLDYIMTILNVDQQQQLSVQLNRLAEDEPFLRRLLYPNTAYLCMLSLCPLSFFTWRAGFKGYGLSKYGRGRILTVILAIIYPSYGALATEMWASSKLTEPFRKENPWYHGAKFALCSQAGIFSTVVGNIGVSFLIANRSGLLPIPDGMHKPGVRQVATQILLGRIKPFSKSIVLSAAFSTAFMFAVGVGGYMQTCSILAKMNKKSLIYRED
jgi:hypothetical protein